MSDAIDGELRAPTRVALLIHLRMCRSCRRVLGNLEAVVRTLRGPGFRSINDASSAEWLGESAAKRMARNWREEVDRSNEH